MSKSVNKKPKFRLPGQTAKKKHGPPKPRKPHQQGVNNASKYNASASMKSYGNRTTNRRSTYIMEDEYIGDINGSVNFTTTQFSVNPGQAAVFPWANRTASLYSEYQFDQLEFYYKPEVTGFATQGQTGKVILSFDYDAAASVPTTKQQVETIDPHNDQLPCIPITLRLDCKQIHKGDAKFVRVGAQSANTDIRVYDAGVLSVSTIGQANTTLVGELHVRYRCKLEKPLLDPAVVTGGVVHFSALTPTTANNFATMTLQAGGTPSLTNITVSGNTITFPAGFASNYLISFSATAATSWAAVSAGSVTGGVALLSLGASTSVRDANASQNSLASTVGAWTMINIEVSVTAVGGTFVLTPGTITGTAAADLWIVSLPTALITSSNPLGVLQADLSKLRAQLDSFTRRDLNLESDYEDETSISNSSSSTSKKAEPLSKSTLSLISEIVSRR